MVKKSVTIEKNTHGDAIALVTGGKRFPSENGSFDIPQEIAETIRLADLGPGIIINFVEKHDLGIAFRAIQKIKTDQGEVVVMVRHTTSDWNNTVSFETYAKEIGALVEERERSHNDVNHLATHFLPWEMMVAFVVHAKGTTVQELLNNARRIAEEIITPAKEDGGENC